MLIIETQTNGKRIVKIKKDWYAGNIGRAYNPNKNYVDSTFMERIQGALLSKKGNQS